MVYRELVFGSNIVPERFKGFQAILHKGSVQIKAIHNFDEVQAGRKAPSDSDEPSHIINFFSLFCFGVSWDQGSGIWPIHPFSYWSVP